jgi:SOS-response transcriptional repressor LexA
MIPFDEIDSRLEALGKDRKWLAEKSGRSYDSIRTALAPSASPSKRSELLQKALSDAIEREESRSAEHIPDQLALTATPDEFDAWCRAYKASDADTLKEWAVEQLNRAAKAWHDHRVKLVALESAPAANLIDLPFYGTVAAGMPGGPLDVMDGTHPVPGTYDPATHYVLRVNGQSMEPDYPDGIFIVCRKLKDGEFAKKGQDVIACDASGAYFKRLAYVKVGKKGETPRKSVPRLVSINPDFPEVVPVADCPIVAVVAGRA